MAPQDHTAIVAIRRATSAPLTALSPGKILLWPHVNVGRAAEGERRQDWDRLTEAMEDVLPRRLPTWERVRDATFIAFDDNWVPYCIPTEDCRPSVWERLITRPSVYGLRTFLTRRYGESRD